MRSAHSRFQTRTEREQRQLLPQSQGLVPRQFDLLRLPILPEGPSLSSFIANIFMDIESTALSRDAFLFDVHRQFEGLSRWVPAGLTAAVHT